MLPTPSTSHVDFERIYEPAEDSYLLLDTLSSESEKEFLHNRFPESRSPKLTAAPNSSQPTPALCSPLVLEVGTGSGVVLSFVHANAHTIFGRSDVLTIGVDVNLFACKATAQTVSVAEKSSTPCLEGLQHGFYLGNMLSDLTTALRPGQVDVLIFNPPYVPTATLPSLPDLKGNSEVKSTFDEDSHLLELSYAGGTDGMETTNRLLDSLPEILSQRGCAYVLLCAQNRPKDVVAKLRAWEGGEGWKWRAENVGSSGKKAGWEKLIIVRIWRESL